MKQFLLRQLQYVLKIIARAIIKKYRPSVIAVTGSVGKTGTKQAIYAALQNARHVRVAKGSFNTEIGTPITIIGDWSDDELRLVSKYQPAGTAYIKKLLLWIKILAHGVRQIILRVPYPEVLILEYGVQKPGDMDELVAIASPSIAVMTAIGKTPVHVEFFKDAEAVAVEKGKLARAVPPMGFVVLDADDERVMAMRETVVGRVITFGCHRGAEIRITNFNYLETEVKPVGIAWKLEYAGSTVPFRFTGILGKPHAYAASAATAVGLAFGLNLVRIAEDIQKDYVPAKHRMHIVECANGSTIIDDSYNASPIAMEEAIGTFEALNARRKVAVLGDMLELGNYSEAAHRTVGKRIAKIADVLVAVGPAARYLAEEANNEKRKKISVTPVPSVAEAIELVPGLLKPGDLVLIKGSRGVALDRLVEKLATQK